MAVKSSRPDPRLAPKAIPLIHLKKRAEFLRAQRGIRKVRPAVTLEVCAAKEPGPFRIGFTASRKVGNAVARNRAKRRLRAAAQALLPLYARAGHDYVLVARTATLTRAYADLLEDITSALQQAHSHADRPMPAKDPQT